jgi:hypothetical protein
MSEHEETLQDIIEGAKVTQKMIQDRILPSQVVFAEKGQPNLSCTKHNRRLIEQENVSFIVSNTRYTANDGYSLYQCPKCIDSARDGRDMETAAMVAVKKLFVGWAQGDKLQNIEEKPFVKDEQ